MIPCAVLGMFPGTEPHSEPDVRSDDDSVTT